MAPIETSPAHTRSRSPKHSRPHSPYPPPPGLPPRTPIMIPPLPPAPEDLPSPITKVLIPPLVSTPPITSPVMSPIQSPIATDPFAALCADLLEKIDHAFLHFEVKNATMLSQFKKDTTITIQSQLDKRDSSLRSQMIAQENRLHAVVKQQITDYCVPITTSIAKLSSTTTPDSINKQFTSVDERVTALGKTFITNQEALSSDIQDTNARITTLMGAATTGSAIKTAIDVDVKWLQDDINQYPLLKASIKKYNHWSVFKKNLEDIILKDDSVTACSEFWEHVNMALTSTLQTNKGLPDFTNLSSKSDPVHTMLPARDDHRFNECSQAYTFFDRVLHSKLTDAKTITITSCPRGYNVLQAYRVTLKGFQLLIKLMTSLCPQLGGIAPSSADLVTTFSLSPGEPFADFHCRAVEAHNEITLRKDLTGQANAIVGKYITLLHPISGFSMYLHPYFADWQRHTMIYNNHLIVFSHALHDIYEYLLIMKVPSTFPIADTPDTPSLPLIGQVEVDPIVASASNNNTKQSSSDDKFPGKQGVRFKQGTSFNTSRYQSQQSKDKPIPKTCSACGMNNYDIIKGVNVLHTCKPEECPFRSPAHIRPKDVRESVIQYNFSHNMKPPSYDKQIQMAGNKRRDATFPSPSIASIEDEPPASSFEESSDHHDLHDSSQDQDDIMSPPPIVGMASNDYTLIDQLMTDPGDITSLQS